MDPTAAVAVYCGSSLGKQPAFRHAASSLGHALATSGHSLVYGGGYKGIMGIVSGAVLEKGGRVTGVVPYAMVAAGGEGGKVEEADHGSKVILNEAGREQTEVILVSSMHDRKMLMAKRAGGFVGLPGGFGTFEEVLEAITWSQLGIQNKPVVLLNVRGFFSPLRDLISNGVEEKFIAAQNQGLAIFVDGPEDFSEHDSYDWGSAAVEALHQWTRPEWKGLGFDWTRGVEGKKGDDPMQAI
ncbi:LOG family protein [Sparassis crispa]|uniref:LOG family protein n=1 Tax=Sparassis crispa TaxID=139825 RepID=A0A401GS59_9APHY|nr:LOG family protein [Sparassis crispa]GBE84564.1 LOG family protein [Sparassis crispa]